MRNQWKRTTTHSVRKHNDLTDRVTDRRNAISTPDELTLIIDESSTIFIPLAARGWPLDRLPASTRLTGVFERKGWRLLGDLHGVSFQYVSKAKNCGQRTVLELKQLVDRVKNGSFDCDTTETKGNALPRLIQFIDGTIQSVPIREQGMFLLRLGGTDEHPETLEGIGVKYSLTRERVRQIVDCVTEQVRHSVWLPFGDLIDKLCENCVEGVHPFSPQLLSQYLGVSVNRCSFLLPFYVRLLGELSPGLPVWPDGQRIGSNVGRSARIIGELKELLRSNLAPRPLGQAFQELKAIGKVPHVKTQELLDALRRSRSITVELQVPDQPTVRLSSPGTRDWVRYVLSLSHFPLTPEIIIKRAQNLFGATFSAPSPFTLANSLGPEDGFYLLDRRALGLRQHFRLPVGSWRRVRSDFRRLLKKERHPVSTTEVVGSRMFEWTTETNAYEVAQILREDGHFVDLGRFLFALSEWGVKERQYVADLIPKALTESGRPMTAAEIAKELQRFRSFSPTSLPTILRKTKEIRDFGFGYYGLTVWQDIPKQFFVSRPHLVSRVVARAEPPLTFEALCRILEIPVEGPLADTLWKTIANLQKVKREPETQGPNTVLRHSRWSLERAVCVVLADASAPLATYEVQWKLHDHFGSSFGERSFAEIDRCLKGNNLFVQNTKGEYQLSEHFEDHLPEFATIRQVCFDILSHCNEIVGCDDLLERVGAEGIETENLSSSMLATLLRADKVFEEVGKQRFRMRQ